MWCDWVRRAERTKACAWGRDGDGRPRVPKAEYASRDFYDVWLPNLAPSAELMAEGKAVTDAKAWASFQRKFRAEMNAPEPSKVLDLLAALSHQAQLAIGCYCEDESRCHRSVLRELLLERGASVT